MTNSNQNQISIQPVNPNIIWLVWSISLLLLCLVFHSALEQLFSIWSNVEEYSHGFFIPCISVYFIWLRKSELALVTNFKDSVLGLLILGFGIALLLLGNLAAIKVFEEYALVFALTGLFTSAFGLKGLKIAFVPLVYLLFMVPLPNFVLNSLSAKLQLISSWIGVEFIRACDILVYLEGNVIDLGGYKLQVVDACSGLRYLFPLSSLAFLCAYLFKGPFWQKLLIFLSSAPLTIFMNSFRIGVIGVLVNYWGKSMAEGFLHDFEGWAVFLLCMSLLFVEMWILSRLSGKPLAFNQLVQIPDDWSTFVRTETAAKALNSSIYTVFLVLIIGGGLSEKLNTRVDIIPQRKDFLSFPSQIASWHGQNEYLGQAYLDELKLTDYVMMNYVKTETNDKINFYSAYYQSQRKGAGVHSPRTCISGSGWRITLFEELNLPNFKIDGEPLKVDRAIIESGESKQLVYFWFQQRGRILTDEIKMKWYIFLDSMMENRTDGSLIRLITEINKSEDISVADQRIQTFMKDLLPLLDDYIPGKTATPAFYVPSDN